jgi:beta-glucanase (GH16 family)
MLGETISEVGWARCGEIDIMEVVGQEPLKLHGTVHGPGYSGKHGLNRTTVLQAGQTLIYRYRIFSVEWSPGKIF